MIFFKNDYGQGAHPAVFQALADENRKKALSYGTDDACKEAESLIRALTGNDSVEAHFFAGGTLTNLTCLSAFLRPYEAVIAAETAHICVHETGAIEGTGHRVLSVPTTDGKVHPDDVEHLVQSHETEQMVIPKVVYISNSTEMGALYTKAELQALRECCDRNHLYLYMDGARLAMALGSQYNDVSWKDIVALTDAFYIGGTKCGALFGEMVVLVHPNLKDHFRFVMRRHGALFAKGMLLGIQFRALLSDNLYVTLGAHADKMGLKLAKGLKEKGCTFAYEPTSNMVFPIVTQEQAKELAKVALFEKWLDNPDGTMTIRLVTDWTTTDDDIQTFLQEF